MCTDYKVLVQQIKKREENTYQKFSNQETKSAFTAGLALMITKRLAKVLSEQKFVCYLNDMGRRTWP